METDAPAILIVDDNEDNRYTLQLLLEAEGYSRLATASGGTRHWHCSREKNSAWSCSI